MSKETEVHDLITHAEAREILLRFNASHFSDAQRERARYSVPADPRRDDDLRLAAYIEQNESREKELRHWKECVRVLERRVHFALEYFALEVLKSGGATELDRIRE